MITKYKLYNESLKDKIKGKSNKDILEVLKSLRDSDRIKEIIKRKLPYELLPDNLIVDSTFYCSFLDITKLPDNLTVNGDFHCNDNELDELPKNLIVNGDFNCENNYITKLPDDLIVEGDFYGFDNRIPYGTKKPDGIKGKFHY